MTALPRRRPSTLRRALPRVAGLVVLQLLVVTGQLIVLNAMEQAACTLPR